MPVPGLGAWGLTTNDTPGRSAAAFELGSIYLAAKLEETDDACQATLRYLGELQADYADLMLIHRLPLSSPGEELWRGEHRYLTEDIDVFGFQIRGQVHCQYSADALRLSALPIWNTRKQLSKRTPASAALSRPALSAVVTRRADKRSASAGQTDRLGAAANDIRQCVLLGC